MSGPIEVTVELWYQPIGYRWATNLKAYPSEETSAFSNIFQSLSSGSATLLAQTRERL